MAGKKGRSGRKKAPSTLANEALERNEMMLPTYLEILRSILEDGSVRDKVVIDTAKYLIDRSQGRPRATHDLRVGELDIWTGDDYARAALLGGLVAEEQERLIRELGIEAPQSAIERNKIVTVLNVWINIDMGSVEVEFELPSGEVVKKKLA